MGSPDQPRDDRGQWTHSIIASLESQLRAKGHGAKARALAIEILQAQGTLDAQGVLTDKGMARQRMGKAGRAKDRAARQLDRKPDEFAYHKPSGKAYLK